MNKVPEFWAICQFYEPFTLGGSLWRWVRFRVLGAVPVKLIKGFKGFVFYCTLTQEYRVHEQITGGFLGDGATSKKAIKNARKNISITPDLREQMQALGDTTTFRVEDAEKALRWIANKKKGESDGSEEPVRNRNRTAAG